MAKLRVSLTPAIGKLEVVTKSLVNTKVIGRYKSVFKGRGLEFADYRDYTQNDDASLIDWKASARANKTLVKEFVEERNLNVFLLIDVSSSMVFGSTPRLKNEYAAELATSLCHAILQASDSVGFALFTDKIVYKSAPAMDPKQFYLLSKTLVNTKNYGGGYNFNNAMKFLMDYLKESSVVMIISDFIGLRGDWTHSLRIAAGKLDIIGVMVRDPRDKFLPEDGANVLVQDPFSKKQLLINPDDVRDRYRQYAARNESMIKKEFQKAGFGFISLTTDRDFLKPLLDFFNRRAKE